ncbi:MAG: IS701 family transposase [Crocosphaera sp.]|uniref:IS701 family transposase n=1 Tax=Crocosphaera sp. TaxID=2729996 RepID=UPI00258EF607|nr:IS701 family transposase [Crocosphaera sp.]MCH2231916.1 IS701 family transposase [Crocinitomicaceae bacterium]MCH2246069.1 IS701 family transposase [Crocosphaera sp.]
MRETISTAMPPCFDRWCKRFDDIFKNKAQKKEFRHYLGGLLGESERKNLSQIAEDTVDVSYHSLRHFLVRASWGEQEINDRRLEVMKSCRQTQPATGFSLIIDDSGHRKSGNFTDGVGRQYIGEIGKTDNGIVVVTSHLYDGTKSLPLDIELYQHANSLPEGKKDPEFLKKPEIALNLIDKTLQRKYRPGIVIIDSGYGNNTSFLRKLENRKLKYLGGIAKNRKVTLKKEGIIASMRIDELAQSLPKEEFTEVELNLDKSKKVWVKTLEVEISQLEGIRSVAIVMNADTFEQATDIDYFITNVDQTKVTPQWVVETYSQRNWVEVFYREAKGWLGFKEYQVRHKRSLLRHFFLVFCAYTFILWHKLTGGLRRRWGNKPLKTFPEALEAFRTAISYRFHKWLKNNGDVFARYKASFGYVWA